MDKRILLACVFLIAAFGVGAVIYHGYGKQSGSGHIQESIDARKELERLYQLWGNNDSGFSVHGTIRLYDAEKGGAFGEATSFIARRDQERFYSQLGPLQNYCDGKWVVQVDSMHQVVSAAKADRKSGIVPAAVFPFEQWIDEQSNFQLHLTVKAEANERVLTISSDFQPQLKSCRIYYDPATYRVRQTELEWWKEGVAPDAASKQFWLTVIDYRYDPVAAIDIAAALGGIVSFGDHKAVLSKAYSHYQLICDDQP